MSDSSSCEPPSHEPLQVAKGRLETLHRGKTRASSFKPFARAGACPGFQLPWQPGVGPPGEAVPGRSAVGKRQFEKPRFSHSKPRGVRSPFAIHNSVQPCCEWHLGGGCPRQYQSRDTSGRSISARLLSRKSIECAGAYHPSLTLTEQ